MSKNISITIIIIVILAGGAYWYASTHKPVEPVVIIDTTDDTARIPGATTGEQKPEEKVKGEKFSGKLEQVNVGCFVDGECYVMVDKKHVTVVRGWSQETVGSVLGVESFGDLDAHIGDQMDVYAQKKSDGTYTLYGNSDFYIKLK